MGVVYLATDTRLDRRVAIKALPAELASDPARLERFEREAKTLAQLNHPNLAGIHGVEEQDGSRYLVLEYVEGETLADRLDRGPIAPDEAVEYAVQIAAGLEAAHDAGVIHRDLKPANVMLTPDGQTKVLDFGLANAEESSSSFGGLDSPTITTPQPQHSPTIEGAILGTAAYMSPEQARGRRVDKRTDGWSGGVLRYEMLVGASPFHGETATDSIGAVLHKDLDLDRLPAETPANLRRVLDRCLVRDKSLRYRDIGDLRLELLRSGTAEPEQGDAASRVGKRVLFITVLLTAALAGAAVWFFKPAPPVSPDPLVRSDISLPEGTRLAHYFLPGLAFSPDGQSIAFAAGVVPEVDEQLSVMRRVLFEGDIMVRRLADAEPVPVAGASGGIQPVFSPDGTRLAFYHSERRRIEMIPVTGGTPVPVYEATQMIWGLDWTDDGRIVFGTSDGLRSIPDAGGPETPLTSLPATGESLTHAFPHVLPDDRGTLYLTLNSDGVTSRMPLMVKDHATGETRKLLDVASNVQYIGGAIIYAQSATLYTVPFDVETLRITGEPRPLGIGVIQSLEGPNNRLINGAAQFAVSGTGDLVYAPGGILQDVPRDIGWVSRDGEFESIGFPLRGYLAPRISPDGSRVVAGVNHMSLPGLWVRDTDRDVSRNVLREKAIWAVFGPGDNELTYRAPAVGDTDSSIRIMDIDNLGRSRVIDQPDETRFMVVGEWSPGGTHLIAVGFDGTQADLFAWSEAEGWTNLTESASAFDYHPAVSPDGRWLAYVSTPVGSTDSRVFVRPFLRDGPTFQVTYQRAFVPIWKPDGSELLYMSEIDPDRTSERSASTDSDAEKERWVFSVSFAEESSRPRLGTPVRVFRSIEYAQSTPIRAWDAASDGRFLMIKRPSSNDLLPAIEAFHPDRIRLIQNWTSTLERGTP